MAWYEILIIVAAAVFVLGVAVWSVVRKKRGKGCCDCSECSACGGCHRAQKKKNQNIR